MKFIDLSNIKTKLYLCSWNGEEIIEIHTSVSLYEKYCETNLFDGTFYEDWGVTAPKLLDRLEVNEFDTFDNFRIERIK